MYFTIVFTVWATGWILGDVICLQQFVWGEKMDLTNTDGTVVRWLTGIGIPFATIACSFFVGSVIGCILLGIYRFFHFLACKWVGKDHKASA
jgi:hypothetical protein